VIVRDLGLRSYQEAHELQLALVGERQRGEIEDTLLLVEHPHVITLGRRQAAAANVLAAGDVPVVEVERGGDVTYHGPGQLVAYPIALLKVRDLHKYLRDLESAIIATLAKFGISGSRKEGATGVWVDDPQKKIASIGIACRKWVVFHGLALNVSTDLAYFARINPCGFEATVMTSMNALGSRATVSDVKPVLAKALADALG
jgi:lipoate-protein ligase B